MKNFTAAPSPVGGTLEMVQLWVNLPAKDKDAPAAYQPLRSGYTPGWSSPTGPGASR